MFKSWLLIPQASLAIAAIISVLAFWESKFAIWAPAIYFTSAITLVVGLIGRPFWQARAIKVFDLALGLMSVIGILALDQFSHGFGFDIIVRALGAHGPSVVPFKISMISFLSTAAVCHHVELSTILIIAAIFSLLWAPLAEETFYRGYLLRALEPSMGTLPAVFLSSAFFGLRHLAHLTFLEPTPWVTAVAWGVTTFLAGLLMCWLVRRTQCLWLASLVHFVSNLINIAIT